MGLNSEMKSCRACGKPLPESAKYNTLYCNDCARRHRLDSFRRSRTKYYRKHRTEQTKEKREEYYWYKARGICVDCHAADAAKKPNGTLYSRCEACMEKHRKKKKA